MLFYSYVSAARSRRNYISLRDNNSSIQGFNICCTEIHSSHPSEYGLQRLEFMDFIIGPGFTIVRDDLYFEG
jgi:hypothetical protein